MENNVLNNRVLSAYEVRAKVSSSTGNIFLNGFVLADNSIEAKKRAKAVIKEKYTNNQNKIVEIVKCTKKKVDFFIKKNN